MKKNPGRELAQLVINALEVYDRWPCSECGRENIHEALRTVEVTKILHGVPHTTIEGCWRCVHADRLIAAAHYVLGLH